MKNPLYGNISTRKDAFNKSKSVFHDSFDNVITIMINNRTDA